MNVKEKSISFKCIKNIKPQQNLPYLQISAFSMLHLPLFIKTLHRFTFHNSKITQNSWFFKFFVKKTGEKTHVATKTYRVRLGSQNAIILAINRQNNRQKNLANNLA